MGKRTKVVALGLIFNAEGEILLTQRYDPKIADAHLLWDIPGGTNEFEEKLEDTVKREALEETGVEIKVEELLPKCVTKTWQHDDYLQHTLVFCYRCALIKRNPSPKDHKIAEIRWESPENLGKYEFLPTTKEFIQFIFQ